jgi:hypothetical protein
MCFIYVMCVKDKYLSLRLRKERSNVKDYVHVYVYVHVLTWIITFIITSEN